MILTIKCVADIQYKKKKSFVVEFNLEILADNLTDFGLTNIIALYSCTENRLLKGLIEPMVS